MFFIAKRQHVGSFFPLINISLPFLFIAGVLDNLIAWCGLRLKLETLYSYFVESSLLFLELSFTLIQIRDTLRFFLSKASTVVLCASAHIFCGQKHFSMFQNIIIPCILCTNKVLVIAIKVFSLFSYNSHKVI